MLNELLADEVLEDVSGFVGRNVEPRCKLFCSPTDGTGVPEKNHGLEMRHCLDLLENVLVGVGFRSKVRHQHHASGNFAVRSAVLASSRYGRNRSRRVR